MSSFTACICRNVKKTDLVLIILPSHTSPSGNTHLLYRDQRITIQHNIEFCNEVHATLLLRNAWDDILDFGVLAETPHLGETVDLSDIIRHIGNESITLRPTMSHLSHIARPDRRSCRFCENGTVPVDHSNPTHTPRIAITQNGRPILTICRHCMGQEFFTEHERRIAGLNHAYLHSHATRGPYRLHLNFIDARRIALGYGALPQYTHIDTLQNGVQWPPDVLPSPPPPLPPLPESRIVYACYLKAKGYDVQEICVLCREEFGRADEVTGLVCGHLFHRHCLARARGDGYRGCLWGVKFSGSEMGWREKF